MVDLDLALLIPELDTESDVCRQEFQFLLGQCRHNRHKHFDQRASFDTITTFTLAESKK